MAQEDLSIDILMATYNGAARLPLQLSSIAAQTHKAWRLIVRDDGSTDATVAILQDFAEAHPGRVVIVRDTLGNLRTLRNFATLLAQSDAQYCGFCDQDDVWDPDKLTIALAALRDLEAGAPAGQPAMIVTDRRVTDDEGRELTTSFWENQGVHPRHVQSAFDLFAYPVAAGSSMLMNAPLRAMVQPIPDTAIMYDCWIELVAARFATTRYIEQPLLTYVRHTRNVSGGGRSYPAHRYLRRMVLLARNLTRQRLVYRRYLRQAEAFATLYGPMLTGTERARLAALLAMPGAFWPVKLWRAYTSRALPPTWERKLAFFVLA
jgi:glycosyltransferase involved in cell wall biosynthesis